MIRYDCKQCNEFFESEDEDRLDKLVQGHTQSTGHSNFTVSSAIESMA